MFFYHVSLYHLTFKSFDFERTWWRLFQKRAVHNKLDICAFIYNNEKKRDWRYQRVNRVRKLKTKRQHNVTLCKVNILLNASCNCGTPCEHFRQFISDYNTYTDYGEIVFNSLYWLSSNINIDVNLLIKGSDLLTYQENTTILKHVFQYIKDSKRFTNI